MEIKTTDEICGINPKFNLNPKKWVNFDDLIKELDERIEISSQHNIDWEITAELLRLKEFILREAQKK